MWRNLLDLITRGVGSEFSYRRTHPCDTGKMFRAREQFWRERGRRVLADTAALRARKWERRCAASGKDC